MKLLKFENPEIDKQIWHHGGGAKVEITAMDGKPLELREAIYLLEVTKQSIFNAMAAV